MTNREYKLTMPHSLELQSDKDFYIAHPGPVTESMSTNPPPSAPPISTFSRPQRSHQLPKRYAYAAHPAMHFQTENLAAFEEKIRCTCLELDAQQAKEQTILVEDEIRHFVAGATMGVIGLDAKGAPLKWGSALKGPNKDIWWSEAAIEFTRLIDDTKIMEFIDKSELPTGYIPTYYNPQCEEKMKPEGVIRYALS
jgi:hypothetical protein